MMEDLLLAYWKKEDYAIDYFFDSCFQNAAYVRIMSLRRMFDAYPYNNTEILPYGCMLENLMMRLFGISIYKTQVSLI